MNSIVIEEDDTRPIVAPRPVPETAPPPKPESVIHTEGVTKRFSNDEVAVKDLSLDIPRGSIVGFIGPSGSGKTTTVRLLTGITSPTSGTISVLGTSPTDFTPRMRERIGYMPQLSVSYPNLSVGENMNFVASLYGMGLLRGKRINELLDFVELRQHKGKLTRSLSGGMQRRLSLASALLQDPELIFLDEPTAGIDPVLRQKFWEYFRSLRERGRTLFITTQYVSEAAYCDFVAVMAQGQLLRLDTPEGLRRHVLGGEVVSLRTVERIPYDQQRQLQDLPFVCRPVTVLDNNHLHLTVEEARLAIPALMEWCSDQNLTVESVDSYQPPFDDVFVTLMRQEASPNA